jgi:hypothetical protein
MCSEQTNNTCFIKERQRRSKERQRRELSLSLNVNEKHEKQQRNLLNISYEKGVNIRIYKLGTSDLSTDK